MTEYRVRPISDLAVIDLRGKLDAFAGDCLDRACAQIGQEVKTVLLNFEGVDYMSSTGIALMIGLIVQASQVGRLTDYISVFPDEAAALAGCRESQYQV